jgi:hypothetical protein
MPHFRAADGVDFVSDQTDWPHKTVARKSACFLGASRPWCFEEEGRRLSVLGRMIVLELVLDQPHWGPIKPDDVENLC